MREILFVTDSCADLPYNSLGDNIKVVPFRFGYKDETETLRDTRYHGKNNNLGMDTHLIESMGVSYAETLNILNYAADNDMDVIILYSSGKMDKRNMEAIEMAATDFKASNMDLRVTCIDSLNISQGLGLHFTKLIELYEMGRTYDELVMYIVRNIKNYRFDIETDDLDYYDDKSRMKLFDRMKLHNNGQSSLLTMKEGKVVVARRCNDLALRRDILIDRFVNDADLNESAAVVYNDDSTWEAEALKSVLLEKVEGADIDIVQASKVVGLHMRPLSLGLAYKLREK